jgi:endoglycosylceramidase
MVGWEYWSYCGCQDPTGAPQAESLVNNPAAPPTGSNVRWEKLAVLERPYPQTVAGTPSGFSYDAITDTFQLRYSTVRASGQGRFPAGSETDVYVPALHYPHGYSVQTTGAAPVSAPGAPILRLASCAGHHSVTVRVRPGRGVSSDCRPPGQRAPVKRRHRPGHVAPHRPARRSVGFTG